MAINNVTLAGRVTKDIELKGTKSGDAIARFTIAVDRSKKDSGADFIRCIAFGKQAETIAKYVFKGDMFGVVGHIQTGSYTDANGSTVYTTDVVVDKFSFLQPKRQEDTYNNDYSDEYANEDLPF